MEKLKIGIIGCSGIAFYEGKDVSPTVMEQSVFIDATPGKGDLVTYFD